MSRKHKINWDYSDDEDSARYPSSLLQSATHDEGESPTKGRRIVVNRPRARSGVHRRKRQRGAIDVVQQGSGSGLVVRDRNGSDSDGLPHWAPPEESEMDQIDSRNSELADAQLETYVDAINAHVAGFYHLDGNLFVVQGWDCVRAQSTEHWYHLEYKMLDKGTETEILLACTCPMGLDGSCIHCRFFTGYDVESLIDIRREGISNGLRLNVPSSLDEKRPIMFLQQPHLNDIMVSWFSVPSASSSALKGRAIVKHRGIQDHWDGIWQCSKDSSGPLCVHVRSVRALVGGDTGAQEDDISRSMTAGGRRVNEFVFEVKGGATSYLAINVPKWAELPSDSRAYPHPPPFRSVPEHPLPLEPTSSCPCDGSRTLYDPTRPVVVRPCKIYTLTTVYNHSITLQPCPKCSPIRRRFIGPDLRERGVFNYNNSVLVSHELLDDYTSAYTSSETPFSAWVLQQGRRYEITGQTFMGEDLFRAIWFSYVSLQAFGGDMKCTKCGDYPDTVIWDGITLAFARKHVRSTLYPPTTLSDDSLVRARVRYQPNKQQLIPKATTRRQIRMILDPPSFDSLVDVDCSTPPPTPSKSPAKGQSRQARLVSEHLDRIATVVAELETLCPALARLFELIYGAHAYADGIKPSSPYKNFFLQIAAEESVLQMVNLPSLQTLRSFLQDPSTSSARLTQLISLPGLYGLLKVHGDLDSIVPIMEWIEKRATSVLQLLKVESPLPPAQEISRGTDANDWMKSGCLYNMPQIRHRPKYPRLEADQQKSDSSGKRGDRCGKYYSQYGEKRLTGGIMVAWCTHSICYGFHCIAESEGRDDVFSAMVTRWPVAPKRVIYDFACALGPYCMLREPDFFQNTYFAIDHFHAAGHTKCSPAAFLSEYANVDPRLVAINSSAAECGNSGLKRIRKSGAPAETNAFGFTVD
ncbi:hypothetical protein CC1G_10789 [Coprinopsis cinerea okayama7|uniref:HMG domain-containing protein n=1 Tax=Coprinopsis cinerea (strain Okayama-7 / 130 / ATCC MYA-4618 / FGSC 9003) TaxID=240176 RepID=A8NMH3_COPC7|nr:hypothetical protein CC1G_10789 [Coprinopsis cinerea okayama7\|eukprot:XP_001834915.2 hypothetical protein CC1G_10789 [Coprinopsis cinerea okayama7\